MVTHRSMPTPAKNCYCYCWAYALLFCLYILKDNLPLDSIYLPLGLLHCRWILYQLSYQGSPFFYAVCPFCSIHLVILGLIHLIAFCLILSLFILSPLFIFISIQKNPSNSTLLVPAYSLDSLLNHIWSILALLLSFCFRIMYSLLQLWQMSH